MGEFIAESTGENPRTEEKIYGFLPLEGRAKRWGKEIYFDVGFSLPLENGRREVEVGEMAYWPAGRAIAIFFGPTPASLNEKPRAFEDVNVFAEIATSSFDLERIRNGEQIRIEPSG